ncbi:hypothetical protein A0H76_815 [Hepatospora eriocheir]|uniref:Uncharacterized protein n=1 Tax=Hepatospora eriocheir TaxID=1081669 RepID=A0A1X0QID7_9MICR|nr:hypothetical protein A0H76_815 [Hepatospora eriocheir]
MFIILNTNLSILVYLAVDNSFHSLVCKLTNNSYNSSYLFKLIKLDALLKTASSLLSLFVFIKLKLIKFL